MPNTTGRLLTVSEVAEALQVSQKSVRRATQRGQLPSVRLGRAVRVRAADVERYIDEHVRPLSDSVDPAVDGS